MGLELNEQNVSPPQTHVTGIYFHSITNATETCENIFSNEINPLTPRRTQVSPFTEISILF